MAVKTIGLSFKNNDEDKMLCDWIYTHSNVSGFIKDILRQVMNSEQKISSTSTNKFENKKNNDNDLIDF